MLHKTIQQLLSRVQHSPRKRSNQDIQQNQNIQDGRLEDMPTKLKTYLVNTNVENKELALEELEELYLKAMQRAEEKNKPGKAIGADELWPEISAVVKEKYGDLANKLSMVEYFRLSDLFEDLKISKGDTNGTIHSCLCQPVLEIMKIAESDLDKKAIPEFIKKSNAQIDRITALGRGHENIEVTKATAQLARNLKSCRDNFIINQGYRNIYTIEQYKKDINKIVESSDGAKKLSSHRGWKGVVGNALLALTGVGILALGAKAVHSKVTKGYVSLFFNTASTKKVDMISQSLKAMASSTPQEIDEYNGTTRNDDNFSIQISR